MFANLWWWLIAGTAAVLLFFPSLFAVTTPAT
jgi:hypothetical protein